MGGDCKKFTKEARKLSIFIFLFIQAALKFETPRSCIEKLTLFYRPFLFFS
jgi:hypothetical protein